MKEKCTLIISSLAYALEMIITIAMMIGTGLLCFRLICSIFHLMDGDPFEAYEHLLSYSMNLIICVELIRMMYYHTSDMVFELLVFALAIKGIPKIISSSAEPEISTKRCGLTGISVSPF